MSIVGGMFEKAELSNLFIVTCRITYAEKKERFEMPKGYMMSAHRSEADPQKRAAYLELAGPALKAAGGRPLAGGDCRVIAKENGIQQRTVLIEFDSFEVAVAAYESEEYQKALEALADGADRDVRLFEGL